MFYGKGFNDGDGDDAPRFIPVGKEPVDFIPIGQEDKFVRDSQGNYWKKKIGKK